MIKKPHVINGGIFYPIKYQIFLYVILINEYWTKLGNCIRIDIVLKKTKHKRKRSFDA